MLPPRARGNKRRDILIETRFYEGLLRKEPQWPEVLKILGDNYNQLGDYGAALGVDLQLTELQPSNAHAHYNLACSFSLTGSQECASEALICAAELGYAKIRDCVEDPYLEKLRRSPEWKYTLDSLRKLKIRISG